MFMIEFRDRLRSYCLRHGMTKNRKRILILLDKEIEDWEWVEKHKPW